MPKKSKKKVAAAPARSAMTVRERRILGLTVNTLGRAIMRNLTRRTARHGVLPGAYPVIAWLMRLPQSSQAELGRLIGVEQPTMAITLRRMERGGIIERTPDPNHGRRSHVRLTPRGKRLSEVMTRAANDVEKVAAKGLTPRELNEFYRLAGALTENLQTR
jgi:MarR family transcriptional regulator, transcriptional regulator for hemolysin